MDLPLFRPFHGKPIYLPTCGIVLVEKYQACSMVFSFDEKVTLLATSIHFTLSIYLAKF